MKGPEYLIGGDSPGIYPFDEILVTEFGFEKSFRSPDVIYSCAVS